MGSTTIPAAKFKRRSRPHHDEVVRYFFRRPPRSSAHTAGAGAMYSTTGPGTAGADAMYLTTEVVLCTLLAQTQCTPTGSCAAYTAFAGVKYLKTGTGAT